jgi:uncharacterized protein with HEPN domain
MRSKEKLTSGVLQDMRINIDLARSLVVDHDFESFCRDWTRIYALMRCLEIISEASRRLPKEIHSRHPQIPWQKIAAAGNFYRHQYDDVEHLKIWNAVQNDLMPLYTVIEAELAHLSKS